VPHSTTVVRTAIPTGCLGRRGTFVTPSEAVDDGDWCGVGVAIAVGDLAGRPVAVASEALTAALVNPAA